MCGAGRKSFAVPKPTDRQSLINPGNAPGIAGGVFCCTPTPYVFKFVADKTMPELPQHLDLAVDPGNDLEVALIGAAFDARNGAVVALGKHDTGKHTGRFLDHVAAGCDHRPVRVGDRIAAAIAD